MSHHNIGQDETSHQDKILHEEEETTQEVADLEMANDYEAVVAKLQEKLAQANDKATRSLADYQNLIRRHREEKINNIKYAATDFVLNLVEPIDHLSLAAAALNDQGLNMVVEQFKKVLADQGVTQFVPQGKKFDAQTMEAVEKNGDGQKVKQVLSPGYLLHDRVIRPARVVVG